MGLREGGGGGGREKGFSPRNYRLKCNHSLFLPLLVCLR